MFKFLTRLFEGSMDIERAYKTCDSAIGLLQSYNGNPDGFSENKKADMNETVEKAIQEATRNRVRPIFMSTLTSIFGMLPLVLFPGSGSELYRGLGSVVLGGLSLSAVLTLALVPPIMSFSLGLLERQKA